MADAVTDETTAREPAAERLRQVARWLAEYGTRRNAVALGVLLLGLAGDRHDRDLLLLLGSLEDLALYASVALARSQPDRDRALYDLARRVAGWGRIHAVRRLAGTQDPEIKAWLLRDGFRNAIMNEYLAHIAATTGDPYGALTTPPVDDDLLDAAGDILTALYLGGPTEDITDYPDAPLAIDRYLTLIADRPPRLARIAVVLRLAYLLTSDQATGEGWTAEIRTCLQRVCDTLAARPAWRHTVEQALDGADPAGFREAVWPARRLGIPTRDRIRRRLHADPDDAYLWQALAHDIDDAVDLARELLPLDRLAGGLTLNASLDTSLDADPPHLILDLLVCRLHDHPGRGWPLIRAALGNRTVRNRNMACRALETWPSDTVTTPILTAVRQALAIEPDTDVRDRMRRLLTTWAPCDDHGPPE